jgi:hypothetical protein
MTIEKNKFIHDFINAGPVIMLHGPATLTLTGGWSGQVSVVARGLEGHVPSRLDVFGEPPLMEEAYYRDTICLELFDLKFRTSVIGHNKVSGALHVHAQPMYRAMSRRVDPLYYLSKGTMR